MFDCISFDKLSLLELHPRHEFDEAMQMVLVYPLRLSFPLLTRVLSRFP